MKKSIALFAFGGLLSTASLSVSADTTSNTAVSPKPCQWCCPPWECGINGPSFDGTSEEQERNIDKEPPPSTDGRAPIVEPQ
ncbi:MAG: hypothetical protein AAGF11_08980 [Myxococcota bacterium]